MLLLRSRLVDVAILRRLPNQVSSAPVPNRLVSSIPFSILNEQSAEIRAKIASLERARADSAVLEKELDAAFASTGETALSENNNNNSINSSSSDEAASGVVRLALLQRGCDDLSERIEAVRRDTHALAVLDQRIVGALAATRQRCDALDGELLRVPQQTHPAHIENLQRIAKNQDSELMESRRRLLESLLCFFPLNPVSETHHRIVNITLPNDSRGYWDIDANIVSAALGHAARLLCAASNYLNVALLHRISLCGSRTRVGEHANGPWYPLYNAGGAVRDDFERAMELFNENIVWIAWAQGIEEPAQHPWQTLPNLLSAFRKKHGLKPQRDGPQFGDRTAASGAMALSAGGDDDDFVVI
jgi:hypothetical protein